MTRALIVFGTRPEAIKMAPLVKEFQKYPELFDTRVCVNTTSSSPFLFDFRQGNYNGGTHHGCGNGRVISLAAGSYVTIYRLSGTMYTNAGANNPHNLISIMQIG